jgi:predicted AlkP superfamily phosphohydrolase/phosphomutase/tetratricopeptide (TPR) repeat protein
MQQPKSEKILLVGWDAADWDIITPLLLQNKMPNLQKLINAGSSGTIQTLLPALSPMLWTSIATGKTADKHGILGFIEPDLKSGNPRPASVTSRQCKAVWNILTQQQLKTNVIGWWPSHPAEPINGVAVSNLFTKNNKHQNVIEHSVYPNEWNKRISNCRVYTEDIALTELIDFVPQALSINQDKDKHLHNLAALIANAKSIQQATKEIISNTEWDFTAVYFDVIDQVCHTFMKFYPPQMAGVPDDYYALYNQVISQMYIYHDTMLGELIAIAGEDTTVMVLSDHLRPIRLPNDPASPAFEHAPFGIFCIKGKNIKQHHTINGASLLDITPTLLNLCSLPCAKDMDGEVLEDLFNIKKDIDPIDSWETIEGNCGMHKSGNTDQSWQSAAALFQLMELGYIQKFEANKELTLKKIINESHYYLSTVLMSIHKYDEAYTLLHQLHNENTSTLRYSLKLAACLQHLHKYEDAKIVVQQIKDNNYRESPPLLIIDAICLSYDKKHTEALELLLNAEQEIKHVAQLYTMIGNEYALLENWQLAEIYFEKALALKTNCVKTLTNLIFVLTQQLKSTIDFETMLRKLSKHTTPDFKNTYDGVNELDFNTDRMIDFRKYQLIIRLFLEQFHKGVKQLK